MAFFSIALVFFTDDTASCLEEEQEDETGTRCTTSAATSSGPNEHHSPIFIDVIINKGKEFRSTSHLPSFHPLLQVQLLFGVLYKTAATVVNMHDRGVCAPPKGAEIAHAIAMFTASWYFAFFLPWFSCLI